MISNILHYKFQNSKIQIAYFLFELFFFEKKPIKESFLQHSDGEEQEGINHALFESNVEQRLHRY